MDSTYLILLIPIVVTLIAYYLYPKKITKWEFIVPFIITLAVVLVIRLSMRYANVNFTEYWGSTITQVYEQEPYNYWQHQTCYYTTCTGSGKSRVCTTHSYDCSHQEDVGPSWYLKTNLGEQINISEAQYEEIAKKFGTSRFSVSSRSNYDPSDYCVGSKGTKFQGKRVGDVSHLYCRAWGKTDSTRRSFFSEHTYENKVKAADLSLFNISVINDKKADSLGLYKYPELEDNLDFPTILGKNISKVNQIKFGNINGKYGASNKLRLWVLVFENKPNITGLYQENYWVRGNKNEFVICLSKDKTGKIQWVHTFSWTTNEELKIEARNYILSLGYLNPTGWEQMYQYLNSSMVNYKKRNFEEFSYLTVELKTWQIILLIAIALVVSIGSCVFVVKNEFTDEYRERF